jgi:hypothetical protein
MRAYFEKVVIADGRTYEVTFVPVGSTVVVEG